MDKVKVSFEYILNCSPKVLYDRLSTASGLAEWFADDVKVKGKKYIFVWDKVEQESELAVKKDCLYVRFDWIEDKTFFEFRINQDELTNDVSLIITDFAFEDEIEETKSLWDTQISKLKHVVGS